MRKLAWGWVLATFCFPALASTAGVGFLTQDFCERAPCAGWKAGAFLYDALASELAAPKRFDTVQSLSDLGDVRTLVLPYVARGQGTQFPQAVTDALYRFVADGGTLVAFGFTDPQWLIQVIRFRLELPVINTQSDSRRTRLAAVEHADFPERLTPGLAVGYRQYDASRINVFYKTVNDPGFAGEGSVPLLTARVMKGRFVHFGLSESAEKLGNRAALLVKFLR